MYRATGPQGQSRQQAYNLYNKLILALTLTLTLTDTGGAVLTLMLGYKTGPNLTLPCDPVPFAATEKDRLVNFHDSARIS